MTQTVVGIFNDASTAQNAVQQLVNSGMQRANIDITGRDRSDSSTSNSTMTDTTNRNDGNGDGFFASIGNFFSSLFDSDDDARRYSDYSQNNTIVTVHANSTEEAERAADLLDEHGAVDVDEQTGDASTMTGGTSASTGMGTNTSMDMDTSSGMGTGTSATSMDIDSNTSATPATGADMADSADYSLEKTRRRSRIFDRSLDAGTRLRDGYSGDMSGGTNNPFHS